MDLQLDGRAVVVTGASSGVGLATTRYLLGEGADVIAAARDLTRLRHATAALPGPGRVHAVTCDVVDRTSTEAMVAEGAERFGRIDGVVCNAGRSLMATLSDTTDDQIREELDLKIFGVWNVVRAARRHLAASDAPAVVTVNAILARQPETRLAVTSAARAALLNLTRSLSQELGAEGIRVNSVALGLIDTGQWRRRYDSSGTTAGYEQWAGEIAADRGIALGRFGRPEEVAFPIVTLLSPLSGYCTGATIDVGGGVSRYV